MLINVCGEQFTQCCYQGLLRRRVFLIVWAGQGSVKRKCMARVLQKARVWLGKERRESLPKGGTAHADARCAEVGLWRTNGNRG